MSRLLAAFMQSYLQVVALRGGHTEEATHGIGRLLSVGRGEGGVVAAGGQVVGGGVEGGGGRGRGKVVRSWRGCDAVSKTTLEELRCQDIWIWRDFEVFIAI